MASNGIEKSILSCSSPGTNLWPNDTARNIQLTRRMNNFTADLKRQYPDKFGYWASLPLQDINATLDEIDRALDVLDADGFVFMSNTFGLYSGDPELAPVYEKLNARNAIVFIHPTLPCDSRIPTDVVGWERMSYAAPLQPAYKAPILEFLFDTTRNLMDLITTGTAGRYGRLKWIIPHCGAVLPSVLDRMFRLSAVAGASTDTGRPSVTYVTANATELLRRQFWFDLAGFSMHSQIFSMSRLFGPSKFLYGSDIPFTSSAGAIALTGQMNETLPLLYNDTEISMIFRGNAMALLGSSS